MMRVGSGSTAARRSTDWLGIARGTAAVAQWTAISFAVAIVAIGIAPKSPVELDVAIAKLSSVRPLGLTSKVAVDGGGRLALRFTDPSFGLRMLNLATVVPGLLLVAEIARRMARLLHAAQRHDPFTGMTVRELTRIAKITALGGIGVWAVANLARVALSSYALTSGTDVSLLDSSPVGWLGAALIVAGFGQVIASGVAMRTELDAVI